MSARGMGNKKKNKMICVKLGLWQLGASTSRWLFVNSRYQVRIGCYQTFKVESIRLFFPAPGGEEKIIPVLFTIS